MPSSSKYEKKHADQPIAVLTGTLTETESSFRRLTIINPLKEKLPKSKYIENFGGIWVDMALRFNRWIY